MNKKIIFSIIATLGLSAPAFAVPPAIDFSTGGTPAIVTDGIGSTHSSSFAGIAADAFVYSTWIAGTYTDTALWQRNDGPGTGEHGLGVCSEGAGSCKTGGGDINELSNQNKIEILRLDKGSYSKWTDIWVSSLDGSEQGILFWSTSPKPDLSTLHSYAFSAGGGPVERSIFTDASAASGWDSSFQYLFFAAGTTPLTKGPSLNNDYLVYGVAAVPEPEIYAMMGIGLALMGFVARRRKQNAAAA